MAVERCQKPADRIRICTQQPYSLGNNWPASQKRTSDVPKLFYTPFMMLVRANEYGNDRTGID